MLCCWDVLLVPHYMCNQVKKKELIIIQYYLKALLWLYCQMLFSLIVIVHISCIKQTFMFISTMLLTYLVAATVNKFKSCIHLFCRQNLFHFLKKYCTVSIRFKYEMCMFTVKLTNFLESLYYNVFDFQY